MVFAIFPGHFAKNKTLRNLQLPPDWAQVERRVVFKVGLGPRLSVGSEYARYGVEESVAVFGIGLYIRAFGPLVEGVYYYQLRFVAGDICVGPGLGFAQKVLKPFGGII